MKTRLGKIIKIDKTKGKGVILDSNQQEISFVLPANIATLQCFAQVSFEIILTQEGLMAVNVDVEQQQKR